MVSNIFLFSPRSLGKWSNFDEHIFQRGWNHQPAIDCECHKNQAHKRFARQVDQTPELLWSSIPYINENLWIPTGPLQGNVTRAVFLIRPWLELYQAALVTVAIFTLQGCEETTCERESIGGCYEQAIINSAEVCGESLLVWRFNFFSCLEIRIGDPKQKQQPWRYIFFKAVFFC